MGFVKRCKITLLRRYFSLKWSSWFWLNWNLDQWFMTDSLRVCHLRNYSNGYLHRAGACTSFWSRILDWKLLYKLTLWDNRFICSWCRLIQLENNGSRWIIGTTWLVCCKFKLLSFNEFPLHNLIKSNLFIYLFILAIEIDSWNS